MSTDPEQKESKKKKGFFKRAFGVKSKDEKLAEEAALRAQQQAKVDAQMAERMAAINAAALAAARKHDEESLGADEEQRLAEQEKLAAQAQALKDVEAAKRLAEEKREAEKQRLAEEERKAKAAAEMAQAAREKAIRDGEAAKAARDKAKVAALKQAEKQAALDAQKAKEAAARAAAQKAASEKAEAERKAAEEAKARVEAQAQAAAQKEKEQAAARAATGEDPSPEDGFLQRISRGLKKSTTQMSDGVTALFTKRKLDDEALEDLEDILIAADLGVGTAAKVTASLARDKFDKDVTATEVKVALADVIAETLAPLEKPVTLTDARPQIMLFVGVNGSGKTTTMGKMAKRYADQGLKVLLVAGDTFRAAAVQQLQIWGERASAPVMSGNEGADAAGLVYDAITRAETDGFDLVMIDTAGRLQNRKELMDELAKVVRVIGKKDTSAPHHCILVLDATVGQNALLQTEAFLNTASVTGLIMTKLDGTAKGGVLVALADKFSLPIHAIGIGERIEDLAAFSAPVFAAALSGIADEVIEP